MTVPLPTGIAADLADIKQLLVEIRDELRRVNPVRKLADDAQRLLQSFPLGGDLDPEIRDVRLQIDECRDDLRQDRLDRLSRFQDVPDRFGESGADGEQVGVDVAQRHSAQVFHASPSLGADTSSVGDGRARAGNSSTGAGPGLAGGAS